MRAKSKMGQGIILETREPRVKPCLRILSLVVACTFILQTTGAGYLFAEESKAPPLVLTDDLLAETLPDSIDTGLGDEFYDDYGSYDEDGNFIDPYANDYGDAGGWDDLYDGYGDDWGDDYYGYEDDYYGYEDDYYGYEDDYYGYEDDYYDDYDYDTDPWWIESDVEPLVLTDDLLAETLPDSFDTGLGDEFYDDYGSYDDGNFIDPYANDYGDYDLDPSVYSYDDPVYDDEFFASLSEDAVLPSANDAYLFNIEPEKVGELEDIDPALIGIGPAAEPAEIGFDDIDYELADLAYEFGVPYEEVFTLEKADALYADDEFYAAYDSGAATPGWWLGDAATTPTTDTGILDVGSFSIVDANGVDSGLTVREGLERELFDSVPVPVGAETELAPAAIVPAAAEPAEIGLDDLEYVDLELADFLTNEGIPLEDFYTPDAAAELYAFTDLGLAATPGWEEGAPAADTASDIIDVSTFKVFDAAGNPSGMTVGEMLTAEADPYGYEDYTRDYYASGQYGPVISPGSWEAQGSSVYQGVESATAATVPAESPLKVGGPSVADQENAWWPAEEVYREQLTESPEDSYNPWEFAPTPGADELAGFEPEIAPEQVETTPTGGLPPLVLTPELLAETLPESIDDYYGDYDYSDDGEWGDLAEQGLIDDFGLPYTDDYADAGDAYSPALSATPPAATEFADPWDLDVIPGLEDVPTGSDYLSPEALERFGPVLRDLTRGAEEPAGIDPQTELFDNGTPHIPEDDYDRLLTTAEPAITTSSLPPLVLTPELLAETLDEGEALLDARAAEDNDYAMALDYYGPEGSGAMIGDPYRDDYKDAYGEGFDAFGEPLDGGLLPLVLPEDSLSLDSPEAQQLLDEAFSRTDKAAQGFDYYGPQGAGAGLFDPYGDDYADAYGPGFDALGAPIVPDAVVPPISWDDNLDPVFRELMDSKIPDAAAAKALPPAAAAAVPEMIELPPSIGYDQSAIDEDIDDIRAQAEDYYSKYELDKYGGDWRLAAVDKLSDEEVSDMRDIDGRDFQTNPILNDDEVGVRRALYDLANEELNAEWEREAEAAAAPAGDEVFPLPPGVEEVLDFPVGPIETPEPLLPEPDLPELDLPELRELPIFEMPDLDANQRQEADQLVEWSKIDHGDNWAQEVLRNPPGSDSGDPVRDTAAHDLREQAYAAYFPDDMGIPEIEPVADAAVPAVVPNLLDGLPGGAVAQPPVNPVGSGDPLGIGSLFGGAVNAIGKIIPDDDILKKFAATQEPPEAAGPVDIFAIGRDNAAARGAAAPAGAAPVAAGQLPDLDKIFGPELGADVNPAAIVPFEGGVLPALPGALDRVGPAARGAVLPGLAGFSAQPTIDQSKLDAIPPSVMARHEGEIAARELATGVQNQAAQPYRQYGSSSYGAQQYDSKALGRAVQGTRGITRENVRFAERWLDDRPQPTPMTEEEKTAEHKRNTVNDFISKSRYELGSDYYPWDAQEVLFDPKKTSSPKLRKMAEEIRTDVGMLDDAFSTLEMQQLETVDPANFWWDEKPQPPRNPPTLDEVWPGQIVPPLSGTVTVADATPLPAIEGTSPLLEPAQTRNIPEIPTAVSSTPDVGSGVMVPVFEAKTPEVLAQERFTDRTMANAETYVRKVREADPEGWLTTINGHLTDFSDGRGLSEVKVALDEELRYGIAPENHYLYDSVKSSKTEQALKDYRFSVIDNDPTPFYKQPATDTYGQLSKPGRAYVVDGLMGNPTNYSAPPIDTASTLTSTPSFRPRRTPQDDFAAMDVAPELPVGAKGIAGVGQGARGFGPGPIADAGGAMDLITSGARGVAQASDEAVNNRLPNNWRQPNQYSYTTANGGTGQADLYYFNRMIDKMKFEAPDQYAELQETYQDPALSSTLPVSTQMKLGISVDASKMPKAEYDALTLNNDVIQDVGGRYHNEFITEDGKYDAPYNW